MSRGSDERAAASAGEMRSADAGTDGTSVASLSGVPFSCASFEQVLQVMGEGIARRDHARHIAFINSESLYYYQRLPWYRDYIRSARFSLCDGVSASLVGRLEGLRIPVLHGPDLLEACCRQGVEAGWRHYFYGGDPGVAERLAERLEARHPGLCTAGTWTPPYRPLGAREDDAVLHEIRAARPDIVWVGLGILKQELWIRDHAQRLGATWTIGVGAAFDYLSGSKRRAPPWMQRLGLDWLYILLHERGRLPRYRRSASHLAGHVGQRVRARWRAERRGDGE